MTQHPSAPARPAGGALPFGLGFLAFIGLPYFNLIITGIVMAAVYRYTAKQGDIAAHNARAAANWGMTIAAVMTITATFFFISLATENYVNGEFFPLGIAPVTWGVLCVAHLVVIIVGLAAASAGRRVRLPAIPFIRA